MKFTPFVLLSTASRGRRTQIRFPHPPSFSRPGSPARPPVPPLPPLIRKHSPFLPVTNPCVSRFAPRLQPRAGPRRNNAGPEAAGGGLPQAERLLPRVPPCRPGGSRRGRERRSGRAPGRRRELQEPHQGLLVPQGQRLGRPRRSRCREAASPRRHAPGGAPGGGATGARPRAGAHARPSRSPAPLGRSRLPGRRAGPPRGLSRQARQSPAPVLRS